MCIQSLLLDYASIPTRGPKSHPKFGKRRRIDLGYKSPAAISNDPTMTSGTWYAYCTMDKYSTHKSEHKYTSMSVRHNCRL